MSVEGPASLPTTRFYNRADTREVINPNPPRKQMSHNPIPPTASNFSKENSKMENVIASAFIANFRGPPTPLELCLPVISGEQKLEGEDSSSNLEHFHPSTVTKRVNAFVQRWGRVVPVPPHEFLKNILQKRGYNDTFVPALSPEIRRPPSAKQLLDYDNEIVWAVRHSDKKKLQELCQAGKSMSACNKYSESIVHMACRRSDKEIVQFLVENGADLTIVDDFGRTPLHDACWRSEPRFDIVTMILDVDVDLIRLADLRGSIPLNYAREEHWTLWCAYLYNQMEKYWVLKEPSIDAEQLTKRQKIDK